MKNIKYSHMNHWKNIPYKKIDNFREFYYEDKTNTAYYTDWDRILRYQKALGFDGIELAPWDFPELLPLFGSAKAFSEFAAERGIVVSGMFHLIDKSHDSSHYQQTIDEGKRAVDLLVEFGGVHLNSAPGNNYFGNGPLNRDQIKAAAKVITEIGRYATDQGVEIGIHNEFFLAINKENHKEYIELTDPRYVHYCMDTAQVALLGEDILEFYDTYHERINNFHLKDTATPKLPDDIRHSQDIEIVDDGTRWFWEPGEGVLDFEGLYKLLKKHNFKGWISLETDQTPDLLASMALSRYYIDQKLNPIYK
ncbi:sugar phosphate isomerase/epimerase family protein [Confluentibacter flavum]|uniref:Sugar phosphate isomerase/epimerase n=1 Tax=Confluentibacter flavum TaxID=1909700 RepID=A0A2N3HHU5_9FLAO|nr:sugar phosphate isomerase/epimerase [Confluentibacter flavum]PKQ44539.1 sugar phosphate isomerase/epimerase [Confluentibacter flavum]